MAPTRPYYAERSLSAAFYDTVTPADKGLAGDLEVYASLPPPGGSILELGAGAGRLSLGLAERGFHVTGVDIAPAMLAQAKVRRAESGPAVARRVEFIRGDMGSLALERTFDAVICPEFALARAPRGMAWRNTFATAARHLRPGGLAAFHLPLIEAMRRPTPETPDLPVLNQPTASGGRLKLYVLDRQFQEDVGRLDELIRYEELDGRGEVLRSSDERLTHYHADPEPLAAAEGLMPDRDPIEIGGVGEIRVYRKAE